MSRRRDLPKPPTKRELRRVILKSRDLKSLIPTREDLEAALVTDDELLAAVKMTGGGGPTHG